MAAFAHQSLTNSQLSKFPTRPSARHPEGLLARLVATLRLWHRRAQERQALARLTSRELADFGASSADVYRELSVPFWRAQPPC